MNTQIIHKFRWIWGWDDDKEEAWLGQMSLAGLHFRGMSAPGLYTFEKGEPHNFVYRLDFKSEKDKDFREYLQLFEDAGWSHLTTIMGWQYFRIESLTGKAPEIFTDNDSKIRKYQRLLVFLLVISAPVVVIFTSLLDDESHRFVIIIYLVLMIFYLYAVVRILMRIQKLKRKI
jgi:hypothetical protein